MRSTEQERVGESGALDGSGAEHFIAGLGASLDARLARRAPARRSPWAYRKAALIHPSNLIALAGILMLGLINPSLQILLVGIGVEILFIFVAPKSRWFCLCLEEGITDAEDAAAQRAREALMAQMADGHRDELGRIDGLIRRIEACDAVQAPRLAVGDELDLRRLSVSYIRLALAHRACEEALTQAEQRPFKVSLRALEAAQQTAPFRVRAALGERLAAAQRRAAFEARLREDIEVISHQLATITDLVHLRYQEALTLGPSAEAERFAQDLEETRSAVRELAALDDDRLTGEPIVCA